MVVSDNYLATFDRRLAFRGAFGSDTDRIWDIRFSITDMDTNMDKAKTCILLGMGNPAPDC